jgi:hypothetical protein
MLGTTAAYDNVTDDNAATSDEKICLNYIRQCKNKRQDGDGHQRHQNSKDAMYSNNGGRLNATKNRCGTLMSGIFLWGGKSCCALIATPNVDYANRRQKKGKS